MNMITVHAFMRPSIYFLIAVVFFAGATTNSVEASHIFGTQITYSCLGNGKYKVYIRAYRDCNGIQYSPSVLMAKSDSFTVYDTGQVKLSVRDVTEAALGNYTACGSSRCAGTGIYGVEEHLWVTYLDLSNYSSCEWKLSWEQCCRNATITTGMANDQHNNFAALNKCLTNCNSSPVIKSDPQLFICHNRDLTIKLAHHDTTDGDTLSYELVAAMKNDTQTTTYASSYTPKRPLTFFGFPNNGLSWPAGFHFDSLTGIIAFRPTKVNEVAVIVVAVKEWRWINGVRTQIGSTRIDLQMMVLSCTSNIAPEIKPPFSKFACPTQQVCIPISTSDDNVNDSVRISWNNYDIPGASFTNNNGTVKHASGEICWTPTMAHEGKSFSGIITAYDNSCPNNGSSSQVIRITVVEIPEANRYIYDLGCGMTAIDIIYLKNHPGVIHTWLIRDSLNKAVLSGTSSKDKFQLNPGVYRLFTTLRSPTPCVNLYVDSFVVQAPVAPSSRFTFSQLSGWDYVFKITPVAGAKYLYTFPDSSTLSGDSVMKGLSGAGMHIIKLRATDTASGCYSETYDTVSIGTGMRTLTAGKLLLYPNPVKDELFIKLEGEETAQLSLNFYDMNGKLLSSEEIIPSSNVHRVSLPSDIAPGIYFVKICNKEGCASFKVQKVE